MEAVTSIGTHLRKSVSFLVQLGLATIASDMDGSAAAGTGVAPASLIRVLTHERSIWIAKPIGEQKEAREARGSGRQRAGPAGSRLNRRQEAAATAPSHPFG